MRTEHFDADSFEPERVLIAAFGGWSDAGAASTTVVEHLSASLRVEPIHIISCDGYVDFHVHRPQLTRTSDGGHRIDWPDSEFLGPVLRPGDEPLSESDLRETVRTIEGEPVSNIFLLSGTEPSRHWEHYVDEILEFVDTWDIDLVIFIGSFFSDAPHTRPIITSITSEVPSVRARYDAERSDYEGPTGISGVTSHMLTAAGIATLSIWAQVPHYVHSIPSPKATLAILDKCEELLNIVIPRGDLLNEANEWEKNIDEIAGQDEEMSRYIERLEEARDTFEGPQSTGDAIAYELERYLRIRPDNDDQGSDSEN